MIERIRLKDETLDEKTKKKIARQKFQEIADMDLYRKTQGEFREEAKGNMKKLYDNLKDKIDSIESAPDFQFWFLREGRNWDDERKQLEVRDRFGNKKKFYFFESDEGLCNYHVDDTKLVLEGRKDFGYTSNFDIEETHDLAEEFPLFKEDLESALYMWDARKAINSLYSCIASPDINIALERILYEQNLEMVKIPDYIKEAGKQMDKGEFDWDTIDSYSENEKRLMAYEFGERHSYVLSPGHPDGSHPMCRTLFNTMGKLGLGNYIMGGPYETGYDVVPYFEVNKVMLFVDMDMDSLEDHLRTDNK